MTAPEHGPEGATAGRRLLNAAERALLREFVREQSCGEWDDKIIDADAERLWDVVGTLIDSRVESVAFKEAFARASDPRVQRG